MKWRVLRMICAAIFISAWWTPSFSQNYYLVIGAFAAENDISRFTSYLPGTLGDTSYTVNINNNVMHFYVLKSTNKDFILAKTQKLQKEIENKDGYTLKTLDEFNIHSPVITEKKLENTPETARASVEAGSVKAADVPPSGGGVPPKPEGKYFKFTVAAANGEKLHTKVHHVDFARGRDLDSFSSGQYVDVLPPGKDQSMTLVCGVFGYKQVEKIIDYANPLQTEGVYVDDQGALVIPYTLERLGKGDVSVMYNVSFYKDAVIMLPLSQKDLDELVDLMRSNLNYVIKVHAHCNGRHSRKILALGNPHHYFDVAGAVEKKGSARQLTRLRGEAIRSYLVEHGIDEDRIKVYGWGGSAMLVDENSVHSKLNDRIEIEILKD